MVDFMAQSSGAKFDESGQYRYRLWRRWESGGLILAWVMLNPSTADAREDDPTVRSCVRIARTLGYGGLDIVNLFGMCATDPRHLKGHPDPIGRENDQHIQVVCDRAPAVVLAWGALPFARERAAVVIGRLSAAFGNRLFCLGKTKNGSPKHPLYIASAQPLVPFLS